MLQDFQITVLNLNCLENKRVLLMLFRMIPEDWIVQILTYPMVRKDSKHFGHRRIVYLL